MTIHPLASIFRKTAEGPPQGIRKQNATNAANTEYHPFEAVFRAPENLGGAQHQDHDRRRAARFPLVSGAESGCLEHSRRWGLFSGTEAGTHWPRTLLCDESTRKYSVR